MAGMSDARAHTPDGLIVDASVPGLAPPSTNSCQSPQDGASRDTGCRTSGCSGTAAAQLGMCAACHTGYETGRGHYESVLDTLLEQRADLFEHLRGGDRRHLAAHILAHAAAGAVGFSNRHTETDIRGTVAAGVDFIDERRGHRTRAASAATIGRCRSHPRRAT
jgi:hypothetical protein